MTKGLQVTKMVLALEQHIMFIVKRYCDTHSLNYVRDDFVQEFPNSASPSTSHFTCTFFSNNTVHPALFLAPFMRFVDGSKMGRHIFDPPNRVATGPCV